MENVATEEFISRTEALKDFEENNARNPNWTPQRVKTLLLRQPAADVAEVVHGRWIRPHWKNNTYCCDCSECGGESMHRGYQWNKNGVYPICPHCGAWMDGGVDHA